MHRLPVGMLGMLIDIALLVMRRIKTAGMILRPATWPCRTETRIVTRGNMVFSQLHHCDGLLGRTSPHGYLRLCAYRPDRYPGDRNGEKGGGVTPSVTSTWASASAFHSAGLACTSMVGGLFPRPGAGGIAQPRTCVSDTPSVFSRQQPEPYTRRGKRPIHKIRFHHFPANLLKVVIQLD